MSSFNFHNVEQNTDEWFALRAGKLTSSNLSKVMANFGKAFGDPAKKLAVTIAIEQISGNPILSEYSNEHMDRGHEQEPLARALYEEETFSIVTNGGFFDCGFMGCSPDGMVGKDGLIEIKSAIPSIHYERVRKQAIDSAYKWQCAANLIHTSRAWLDFVSFCADFPEGKRLFVYRLYWEEITKEAEMIQERSEEFETLVKATRLQIETGNYSVKDQAA